MIIYETPLQFVNGTVKKLAFFFVQVPSGLFTNQNQSIDEEFRLFEVLFSLVSDGIGYFTQKDHGLKAQGNDVIEEIQLWLGRFFLWGRFR